MQINTDNIAQQCINAINEKINNLKQLNIIIIGKSGVGKSTLINSLFRGNFAETGLGRPVTQEIRKIVKNISHICANFIGLCVSLFIFAYCYRILCFNSLHIPSFFPYLPKLKTEDFYPSNVVILFCKL